MTATGSNSRKSMRDYNPRKDLKTRRLGVALSVIISFCFLFFVFYSLVSIYVNQSKDRCAFVARNESVRIVTTIDCVMARTNALIALVQDHNGETDFFDGVADDVYDDVYRDTGVSLKNVAIAPDCIVSSVYPYEGNESLIGFDFLDLSKPGNLEAARAYENGETILTNPFELVQGGSGMAGRAPVMVRNDDGRYLWGLVTVTIDMDNFLDVIGLDALESMGLNYELSFIDDEGIPHIMKSSGKLWNKPVRNRFAVRNLTWELAVSPVDGWIPIGHCIIDFLLILTISVFTGIFANMFYTLRSKNTQLIRLSNMDELTDCFNRRAYEEDLTNLGLKPAEENLVCISMDVNGLKNVNDTIGHLAGDELIRGSAFCFRECLDKFGVIYRIGGDEFTALIHADQDQLSEIKKALQKELEEWKGIRIDKLSVSIGYAAQYEFPDLSADRLAKLADERMYEDKRAYYSANGRDRRRNR